MIEQTVAIGSSFDTRTVAIFVQTASKFNSSILIKVDGKVANAKSIMGVISLSITEEQKVQLIVDGNDEQQAVMALGQFFYTP